MTQTREFSKWVNLSWMSRSTWQPLVVWLPDLHGDVIVHVSRESYHPHGPAAAMPLVSRSVRDAADSDRAVPLCEAFSPAGGHQGRLSTGQQRNAPLRRHRLPNTDAHLDQDLGIQWWAVPGPSQLMKGCDLDLSIRYVMFLFSLQIAANKTFSKTLTSYQGIWRAVSRAILIFLYLEFTFILSSINHSQLAQVVRI